MPELPDLSLPDETRGKLKTPWDLKPMLYQGGAAANLNKVNALIDAGLLGEPVMGRLGLIKKLHEILKNKQVRGSSKNTIDLEINEFRMLLAWADTNGHPVDLESIQQTYLEWTEHLVQRVRVRKDLKQATAYHAGQLVGTLLDTILDRNWPLLHSSRLEPQKVGKTPLGIEADKQNLELTFRLGHLLQDICDHLTLDILWGPLPMRIPLREGHELEEWSGLRAEAKLISTRRDTYNRRRVMKRIEATRTRYAADRTLRTRMPLANLRIESELLMFIGQTGMNLTQAHQLKLRHFSYASYSDGYQVRDYKERRGGPVLFEIFHEYKKHFERYLDWRRQVFPDESLMFPLIRHGRAEDTSPYFERIKSACAKAGITYVPPRSFRNTRVNWLLRRSRDPDLTADMDQHTKQTLLSVYERPSLQVAISEVTRFWVSSDPALARTVPVAPGVCDGEPEPITGTPVNVAQADCVQRTGCLWCAHHRDLDSQDYVWELACFCHLKVIELSSLRGGQGNTDSHPARHAVDRLHQKIRWFQDSNELRRSWAHEAIARVEEGNYHPDWVRLLEDMEGEHA